MLFAKRDLKDVLGQTLGQRFTGQLGRYLSSKDDSIIPKPIRIPACYALLGEHQQTTQDDLEEFKLTAQHIIRSYNNKTGSWLNQEQIAFAAIFKNTKQQAAIFKAQLKQEDLPLLVKNNRSSALDLSLFAEAFHTKQFIHSAPIQQTIKPCSCQRTLNLPLNQTSMTEIESIGREAREDCEANYLKQGIDLEGMQTCWRLTLHYADCEHSLTLKCMPIEMLQEVFEAQHFQKFGTTDNSRTIIIKALEIKVRASDSSNDNAAKDSYYVEQWMSQWAQNDEVQKGLWQKQDKPAIQAQFSWLSCPILEEILAETMPKQANVTIPDFFLKNQQKDVDEVVMRN